MDNPTHPIMMSVKSILFIDTENLSAQAFQKILPKLQRTRDLSIAYVFGPKDSSQTRQWTALLAISKIPVINFSTEYARKNAVDTKLCSTYRSFFQEHTPIELIIVSNDNDYASTLSEAKQYSNLSTCVIGTMNLAESLRDLADEYYIIYRRVPNSQWNVFFDKQFHSNFRTFQRFLTEFFYRSNSQSSLSIKMVTRILRDSFPELHPKNTGLPSTRYMMSKSKYFQIDWESGPQLQIREDYWPIFSKILETTKVSEIRQIFVEFQTFRKIQSSTKSLQ